MCLTNDERIVLRNIPRVEKPGRTNVFHVKQVERKRECWGLNVPRILKQLENKGYVQFVKKDHWRTTSQGRIVSHNLINEKFAERYNNMRIIRK